MSGGLPTMCLVCGTTVTLVTVDGTLLRWLKRNLQNRIKVNRHVFNKIPRIKDVFSYIRFEDDIYVDLNVRPRFVVPLFSLSTGDHLIRYTGSKDCDSYGVCYPTQN